MSIASEIQRLQNAKAGIAQAMAEMGVHIPEDFNTLSAYPTYIYKIRTPVSLQSKPATPTEAQQFITADEGFDGLSVVTVAPIPDKYQDVSGVTASAEDVLSGKVFVASDGSIVNGAMPNNGDVSGEIDTLNNTSVTIPKGYTTGGTVSLVGQFAGAVFPWKVIEDVNIAERQFANGTGLVGVRTAILPNVETIGTAAFIASKELEIIDIGENVNSIHLSAFNTCTKLKKLIFRGLYLPTDQKIALSSTPIATKDGGYIYVPDVYLEQYKAATYWKDWEFRIKPISEL